MARQDITAEHVREIFNYDPVSGVFTYRIKPINSTIAIGDEAGWLIADGYLRVEIGGYSYSLHRLVFLYMTGRWPTLEVDHINTIRNDNRWVNLREANKFENMQNRAGANKNSTTGLMGVKVLTYKKTKYYRAAITANGVRHYLGTFDTAELAHSAYLEAKIRLHPKAGVPC